MPVETIEVVSDLAGLRALGEGWNGLAARFASPFLRHEWNLACAEAFGASLRPAVHVLRSGGRIAAIAPLALVHGHPDGRRRPGVRRLEMLGVTADEPGGFLYRDEASLRELLRGVLTAGRRPLSLWQFDGEGVEARLLRELVPRSSVCVTRDAGSTYWVVLDRSWRDFEARVPAKRRSALRRRRRQAEKLGEVRFEAVAADEGNVDRYLEEFYRVEAAGWKTRSGTAILSMPHMQRFYTLYGRAAARLGLLRFYVLRVNGTPAAATIMVDHGNRLWGLKIGHDERFRRVSPGLLLAQEVLRHACERDYEAVEFLGAADSYKTIWTDRRRHYCSIRVYPLLSLRGGLAIGGDLVAFTCRQAARVLRALDPRGAGGLSRPPTAALEGDGGAGEARWRA